MSDIYEYDGIDERAKVFARMELNEVPSQVNDHIDSFRKWVKSMPHLHCPTDANFLLRFLRVSKYDHKKAQQRLDNFCTVRSSPRGSPSFFQYLKIDDPIVDKYLKLRYFVPLGKTDAGHYVAMFRTKYSNFEHFSMLDLVRLTFMTTDVILSQQQTQIFGFTWFEDFEGVTQNIIDCYDESQFPGQTYTIYQNYLPLRMKAQIFCNDPHIFDLFYKNASPYMKPWLKSQTYNFGDTKTSMERTCEIIPGLEKILPKEYGGHGGTLEECAERWDKIFKDYFKDGDPLGSICVDELKRPKETLFYFEEYDNLKAKTERL